MVKLGDSLAIRKRYHYCQTVVTKTKTLTKSKTYKSLIRLYFEDFVS